MHTYACMYLYVYTYTYMCVFQGVETPCVLFQRPPFHESYQDKNSNTGLQYLPVQRTTFYLLVGKENRYYTKVRTRLPCIHDDHYRSDSNNQQAITITTITGSTQAPGAGSAYPSATSASSIES